MTAVRAVWLALAVVFLTCCFAAVSGDAMTWDGAALFFTALDGQHLDCCFLFRDVARSLEPTGLPAEKMPSTRDRVQTTFGSISRTCSNR